MGNSTTSISLREAINKKCKECIYDQSNSGDWRMQVKACSCLACPLYQVRPLESDAKTQQEAILLPISERSAPQPIPTQRVDPKAAEISESGGGDLCPQ